MIPNVMSVTISRMPVNDIRKAEERQMVQKSGPSEEGARQSVEDGKGRHELVRELQARWRPYVMLR